MLRKIILTLGCTVSTVCLSLGIAFSDNIYFRITLALWLFISLLLYIPLLLMEWNIIVPLAQQYGYHRPVNLSAPEVEETDLYAYKIFQLEQQDDGSFCALPLAMTGFGQYNIIGPNYYWKEKTARKLLTDHLFVDVTPYTDKLPDLPTWSKGGYMLNRVGFYSFKKPTQAIADLHMVGGIPVIAKIRIWGDVIEASRGFQSEYFEFVEFYRLPKKLEAINTESKMNFPYTNEQLADLLGWPGKIKNITSSGKVKK